jgi:hypothetical protein
MNKDVYLNVKQEIINGADMIKSTPLISFEALVDIDIGIINYVLKEFRNPIYFDLERVDKLSRIEIIGLLYKRKIKNPLSILINDNLSESDILFLDKCYVELLHEKYNEILPSSLSTGFINVLDSFSKSGDINPTILYYNDYQKIIIENNSIMSKVKSVSLDELSSRSKDNYSQFYFKKLDEAIPFMKLTGKTFYFSTSGLNLNEENNDIKDHEVIREFIYNGDMVSVFDMYRMDIIGRY